MQINEEKIILFPKWKEDLENESLLALQEKRYEDALTKLDKLLEYKVDNNEIFIGKLMCLIELGRFDEALEFSETLLVEENEDYYQFAHIYLTVLFQTNQYGALIDRVTYELENPKIPSQVEEQFRQLYLLSKEMQQDIMNKQAVEYINDLSAAIQEENHSKQWRLIENLRRMNIQPTEDIFQYLIEDMVHPVVKTSIVRWLKDREVSREVEVDKLGILTKVRPSELMDIRENLLMKEIMLALGSLEQENPSLYILLDQLLYRYAYVKFPMVPKKEDILILVEALRSIGNEYLHKSFDHSPHKKVAQYIEEIKMCEALYLSIIEE